VSFFANVRAICTVKPAFPTYLSLGTVIPDDRRGSGVAFFCDDGFGAINAAYTPFGWGAAIPSGEGAETFYRWQVTSSFQLSYMTPGAGKTMIKPTKLRLSGANPNEYALKLYYQYVNSVGAESSPVEVPLGSFGLDGFWSFEIPQTRAVKLRLDFNEITLNSGALRGSSLMLRPSQLGFIEIQFEEFA
jgi:hypothetical protein